MLETNRIYCTDAREGLKNLPDESVDCVVTSPPYWATRDYGLEPIIWGGDPKCRHDFAEYSARLAHENRQNLSGGTIGNPKYRRKLHGHGTSKAGVCGKCGAWRGSLGLEPDFNMYVEHLCSFFDEVHRVLKPTGTCWVNIGDTYAGSNAGYVAPSVKKSARDSRAAGTSWPRTAYEVRSFIPPSAGKQAVRARSLCQIPARFAITMCERGWILRNDMVWHKTNPMPASVKNRFTCSWEHLFLLVKQPKYYFDLDAVRVPHKSTGSRRLRPVRDVRVRQSLHSQGIRLFPNPDETRSAHSLGKNPGDFWSITPEMRRLGDIIGVKSALKVPQGSGWIGHAAGGAARTIRENDARWLSPAGKNPADVWEIATTPSSFGHFAMFPEKLIERPILAGCPERVCKGCGVPKLTRKVFSSTETASSTKGAAETAKQAREATSVEVLGCRCKRGFQPGIVLDPFMGAGTTAAVAKRLGRSFIGFELSPSYVAIAGQRLRSANAREANRQAASLLHQSLQQRNE